MWDRLICSEPFYVYWIYWMFKCVWNYRTASEYETRKEKMHMLYMTFFGSNILDLPSKIFTVQGQPTNPKCWNFRKQKHTTIKNWYEITLLSMCGDSIWQECYSLKSVYNGMQWGQQVKRSVNTEDTQKYQLQPHVQCTSYACIQFINEEKGGREFTVT